ncbi:hypothetical protein [Clostridium sp.]|uniref:hypothetical protein n=1 Tax=Clostridium sp. TaxID=1506 RepID=UPI00290DE9F4|nr:hypothetical protein [Clostridium sp.]MDU5108493.1 hypothetical protein [Clostridium sp.]
MKKIIWESLFVELTIQIIMLVLVFLGKSLSDLIASIFLVSMAVCLISSISIQRKSYIENVIDINVNKGVKQK